MEYFKATFRNKGIHGCEVSRMENSKRSLMIYFYHLIMNNDIPRSNLRNLPHHCQKQDDNSFARDANPRNKRMK